MTESASPKAVEKTDEKTEKRGFFSRFTDASVPTQVAYVMGGIGAFFLIALILALVIGIATGDSEDVAALVAVVRDLFIILLAMQAMLIALALIVLILQLASLTDLLHNEMYPILKNLQDASQTLRGTGEFLSKNVSAPVIETKAMFAGISTFFREVSAIRSAVRSKPAAPDTPAKTEASAAGQPASPAEAPEVKAADSVPAAPASLTSEEGKKDNGSPA